jgi:hypothetical protein
METIWHLLNDGQRLFIIDAMALLQNKRLQRKLKTLHPIVRNIDRH